MVSGIRCCIEQNINEFVIFNLQPQNEYIEQFRKRHGYRFDYHERKQVI